MSNFIIRRYGASNYFVCFNPENGQMLRCSMSDEEPFWNQRGPELLDISITNYCERGCNFCYRKTSSEGIFMSLEQYTDIVAQAKTAGILQIATNIRTLSKYWKLLESTILSHPTQQMGRA